MKDILIKYPIKILQQELINIRTNYRLEKKKLIEILRTMKSIKKLTKEQLVDLLIENKVDISKLPKLEDLEKPIKKEGKPKISTGKNQSLTRKQLEEMKLKSKPKKELSKELLDLYKTIEINLKEVIRLSNNIYEKSQPYYSYSDRGYINTIVRAEKQLKENPRLINIKKQLIDYYISVEKTRKKLNDEYDNFIEDVIDYYELSPYRFNFLVAYLNSKTNRKSYIDELLIEIFEGKRKNEDYYYNDEFNNYIFEIGKVRVKENDIMTYNAIQEKRIVPITQDLIKKEIIIFISKFLEQLDYDNIQDFYDNNKDLFVPNLKLYEKFIKAFKLKENDESFIRQIKQKYDYQIIQDFKIKSEEEIIGTKKHKKTKV